MMFNKKLTLLVTALGLVMAQITPLPATMAAEANEQKANSLTYSLPANLSQHIVLSTESIIVTNPQSAELLRKNLYLAYESDSRGGFDGKLGQADTFALTKKGFLLSLYNWIGVLSPVYPQGYNPADIDRQIAQASPYSDEWSTLREMRAQKNLQARLQALIQAGYLQPQEIGEGWATKEFVATVLYRMFKEVRPYQGSVAPIDSQSIAVRWAIEVGLPGFAPDQNGKIFPQNLLSLTAASDNFQDPQAYQKLFDFLTAVLPAKKTAKGWEYYQLKVKPNAGILSCPDCFISVDGKPLQQLLASKTLAQMDAGFLQQLQQIRQNLNAQAVSQFPSLLQRLREDARKPRVWDWRKDVLENSRFQTAIADYRKTKSEQAAYAVYRLIGSHYHLFPQQDSLQVIKSVLNEEKAP